MYRKHCAPAVQPGQVSLRLWNAAILQLTFPQLILPEGFKLLPLYTLCMLKSKPLKGEYDPRSIGLQKLTGIGGNVTCDVRTHYMRIYRSLGVNGIMNLLYPRMLAVHDLAADVGFLGSHGRLRLPAFMRASYAYMVAEGAYILCKSISHSCRMSKTDG